MVYDLHITRAKWHWDSEKQPITVAEWLGIVEGDPELRLAGYNGPYFAIWNGSSECPEPWLDWLRGEIYSKSPDDALIDKMVQIARGLGAKVQGDDGEVYIGGGRSAYPPPPDST